MFKAAIKKLIGSRHKREAKKLQPLIDEINSIYDDIGKEVNGAQPVIAKAIALGK